MESIFISEVNQILYNIKNNLFIVLSIAVLSLKVNDGFTRLYLTTCYTKYLFISLNFSTKNFSKCLTLKNS